MILLPAAVSSRQVEACASEVAEAQRAPAVKFHLALVRVEAPMAVEML